jgi:hypothetical protein
MVRFESKGKLDDLGIEIDTNMPIIDPERLESGFKSNLIFSDALSNPMHIGNLFT